MHLHIITLIAFCAFTVEAAPEEDKQAYEGAMSLKIAYSPKEQGIITVTLTNISDSKLVLMLNTKKVEGEFKIEGAKENEGSFYDRDYLSKLLTSQWFSGSCDLKPKMSIRWAVKLEELVYFMTEKPVTHASLAGKTFSLKLDRLAVFPAPEVSNVYVNLESNTVSIPKIEQVDARQPAANPTAVAKAFIAAIVDGRIEDAAEFVLFEDRHDFTEALNKGVPELPKKPEVLVQIKKDGKRADVSISNAKPPAHGRPPFGLDMELIDGKWWIVK